MRNGPKDTLGVKRFRDERALMPCWYLGKYIGCVHVDARNHPTVTLLDYLPPLGKLLLPINAGMTQAKAREVIKRNFIKGEQLKKWLEVQGVQKFQGHIKWEREGWIFHVIPNIISRHVN
jgi:hypothetical protein